MKLGQPMKPRQIGATHERGIIHIPLGRSDDKAIIAYDDFQRLAELGLSSNWHLSGGNVCGYALRSYGRVKVPVARLLLKARSGEKVRYADGNRLNLRRENISLIDGYSVGDASGA
jgi:hypothetical protein